MTFYISQFIGTYVQCTNVHTIYTILVPMSYNDISVIFFCDLFHGKFWSDRNGIRKMMRQNAYI